MSEGVLEEQPYGVVDMHEKCRRIIGVGNDVAGCPNRSCFYKIGTCRLQLAAINFVEQKYVPFIVQSGAQA